MPWPGVVKLEAGCTACCMACPVHQARSSHLALECTSELRLCFLMGRCRYISTLAGQVPRVENVVLAAPLT